MNLFLKNKIYLAFNSIPEIYFCSSIFYDVQSIFFSCIILHFGNTIKSWSFQEVLFSIYRNIQTSKECPAVQGKCLESHQLVIMIHVSNFCTYVLHFHLDHYHFYRSRIFIFVNDFLWLVNTIVNKLYLQMFRTYWAMQKTYFQQKKSTRKTVIFCNHYFQGIKSFIIMATTLLILSPFDDVFPMNSKKGPDLNNIACKPA